jgi:hypothetical protein
VNALAAAALATGEMVCEFSDGYRKSLLAEIAGEPARTELTLIYEFTQAGSAHVLASNKPGRRRVLIREGKEGIHFIQPDGASVRVTSLTSCSRTKVRGGEEICTRFAARHAWHFDTSVLLNAEASLGRQPSGAAAGACEAWRAD